MSTMFTTTRFTVREIEAHEVPRLQALFDANPEYSMAVNGRLPHADEAQVDFDERPPPHLTFTRRWFGGLFDVRGELVGVAIVLTDLSAPGVWHLGLFLVATALHGSGAAAEVCTALEAWAHGKGARWMRLGVVLGNTRAERFWQRRGYTEVRRRENVDTGGRINTVRVLAKPLGADDLVAYLELVPRDRPDSPLP